MNRAAAVGPLAALVVGAGLTVVALVLSNKTVQAGMGGGAHCVSQVAQVPLTSNNAASAGDYKVYLKEVNGPGSIVVIVDPTASSVLGIWP
ncbi:MAG TPA: hypothetical protein VMS77_07640 [Conexivisphaerales archaeon]|nr:hypothetical protein [Conexivisphaerales archaeon]